MSSLTSLESPPFNLLCLVSYQRSEGDSDLFALLKEKVQVLPFQLIFTSFFNVSPTNPGRPGPVHQ